ncbi:Crp/Fnr family transcriptional regulator [Paenibacillus sp. NEAU-GSW1]|uniref:Crp/Fnr family transcriptional regulator n=1 Tax=Paenibacillus sp. NEAU-GSW1 TaxID=2682486 RepID=UPI0012E2745C|nr:Crp/Fnr family transcriptional regulator [Paenibacillus sp. NEAU-GSW1]MUT66501.1 cyclic nucleotide-binding domain-containing protein [Paenibacillus sp. NEAU-GSW1]
MEETEEPLYAALQRIAPIPREEWNAFRAMTERRKLAKNSHFIREGDAAEWIGICISGLFRLYYTTPDGGEYNKSFCKPHEFIATYSSMLLNAPSFMSIQALADSELLMIRYTDFQSLYNRHRCWDRLGRLMAEQLFVKKEIRERELLLLSAEERYRSFLDVYGQLEQQIQQYHIASYLGITPVALSRIRRKINLG